MANTFLNTARTVSATSNPVSNLQQVTPNSQQPVSSNVNSTNGIQPSQTQGNNAINPITIPIQIQPQIAQTGQPVQTNNNQAVQTIGNQIQNNTQQNQAPTPQQYQTNTQNNNVVDFNQIYKNYQSQYGNNQTNNNIAPSGVKKTTMGTTIVTPITSNLNTVQGQYQSAYADTVNGVISEMFSQLESLKSGNFGYDPNQDMALRMASEYAANSTLQSLAGSGVLNSSATAERIARIVSELIPQYEQKAYDRQMQYLSQLADTAQVVMQYDSQQFEYWKDAKDREFQNKQFEYQKQQDAIDNAWKRVDELGYVDNDASAVLGVKVGTLSGAAREAKEQREFELQKMREQLEIERANDEMLYRLKSELDLQNSKTLAEYENSLQIQRSKELAQYENNLQKDLASYENSLQTQRSKELASYQSQLNREEKKNDYELAKTYGTSGNTIKTTNLSTYDDIIKNTYADYDEYTKKYTVSDSDRLWNYLQSENEAGRLSDNDALALIAKYNVKPTSVQMQGNLLIVKKNGQIYTLTVTNGANKQSILNWGKNIGVDLSSYV